MILPRLIRCLALPALLLCASTTFALDLSGHWCGTWNSNCTRHKGPLQADFVRTDPTHYCVHFTGRFFKIMPFQYTVTLEVVEESADSVTLRGSSYLGRLFGTFCYTATADDCHFNASYTSKKDSGCFNLTRVTRTEPCATCQ
jgi:hypothetical protein